MCLKIYSRGNQSTMFGNFKKVVKIHWAETTWSIYRLTDKPTSAKKYSLSLQWGRGGLKIYILIVIDGWTLNSNRIFLSISSTLCVIGKRSLELFTNQKQFSSLDMTKLLTSTRWIPGSVNENSLYIRYQGIDPWWAKIRAIKEAFSPTDVPSCQGFSPNKRQLCRFRGVKNKLPVKVSNY